MLPAIGVIVVGLADAQEPDRSDQNDMEASSSHECLTRPFRSRHSSRAGHAQSPGDTLHSIEGLLWVLPGAGTPCDPSAAEYTLLRTRYQGLIDRLPET